MGLLFFFDIYGSHLPSCRVFPETLKKQLVFDFNLL